MQLLQILYFVFVLSALLLPPVLLVVSLVRRHKKLAPTFFTLLGLRLAILGSVYNFGFVVVETGVFSRPALQTDWFLVWAILVSWFSIFGHLTLRNYRQRVDRYWDKQPE